MIRFRQMMRKTRLSVVVSLTLLLATGCFQLAGDPNVATPISQIIPSPTPQPPTQVPPTADTVFQQQTAQALQLTQQSVDSTARAVQQQNVANQLTATANAQNQAQAQQPTTVAQLPGQQQGGVVLGLNLNNRQLIASATARNDQPPQILNNNQLRLTATAQAANLTGGQQSQQNQQNQQIDPFALTSTKIIFDVTQTAVFPLTQTAIAQGIGATLTPTPQQPNNGNNNVPQPPGTDCDHEVSAGENLFRIALRYGVTVSSLVNRNGISNMNLIFPGQKITIPECGTTGEVPPPTSTPQATAVPTAQPTVVTGSASSVATPIPANARRHIVTEGQTLYVISITYDVSIDSIAAANGIINPNQIKMGQELVIPNE